MVVFPVERAAGTGIELLGHPDDNFSLSEKLPNAIS
jgi:hypothetical protein